MASGKLFRGVLAVFCLLPLAVGPSCSRTPKLNPVEGKVLYQGQPLAGALVAFHPKDQDAQDRSTGLTKEDGTFSLTTGAIEGAPVGQYVVTVICSVPVQTKTTGMSMGGEPETEDRLKGAYANPDTSQIDFEIKEGPNQLPPIELK